MNAMQPGIRKCGCDVAVLLNFWIYIHQVVPTDSNAPCLRNRMNILPPGG